MFVLNKWKDRVVNQLKKGYWWSRFKEKKKQFYLGHVKIEIYIRYPSGNVKYGGISERRTVVGKNWELSTYRCYVKP